VLIAVLCVHWFNPLVWAMYILANRDIELSCDEAVVRLFGENTRAAYARTLISMEETRSGLTPLCNNFNKNAIEERITAIMKMKKTSMFSLVLAVALIVGVTTGFATSAASADDGREVSLDDLDYVEGAVGTENNGIRMIETDSRTMDLDDLDYVEGTVRTESNGLRMTENILWRVEDLANLEYVEGDVGAEAHGIKIIEAPEH